MKLIPAVRNWLIPILLTTSLSGCFGGFNSVKPVEIVTTPIERQPLNLPKAEPLSLKPIKWVIITPDNYDEIIDMMNERGDDLVFFAITPNDYEIMSLNLLQIRNFIEFQAETLKSYKQYYESENAE